MNKKEIIDLVTQNEQMFIDKLETTLGEYKEASDLDEQQTIDRQEMSQANEAKEMQLRLQMQYNKALADLSDLKEKSEQAFDTAVAGALLETDKAYYLMGTALHNLSVKDKTLYGVSSESPAFANILGKKVGEDFIIGDTKHKIIAIM